MKSRPSAAASSSRCWSRTRSRSSSARCCFAWTPMAEGAAAMFQRILVANRGEIALRVIRACRDLGVEVVAVYSEADRGAPYLALADEAICIGPGPAADSYLNIPRLISAAEIANVQAIHPGYGFLSENAHFAEVCRSCRIEFIGPPHRAMEQLGNKNA